MNDVDLEERLAKYRPVGPTDGLRERVLSNGRHTARGWISMAALLCIIVVLHVLAARERRSVQARLGDSTQQEMLIQEFAERLGGDAFAFQTARALIEIPVAAEPVQ